MALPPFSQSSSPGRTFAAHISKRCRRLVSHTCNISRWRIAHRWPCPRRGYGGGSNYYAVTSPVAMSSQALPIGPAPSGGHRAPPPHSYAESTAHGHELSPPAAGRRTGFTSPTSPTTHLHQAGIPPSAGSSSSSSYPSISKMPGPLPKQKRRTASDTQSNDSWDEDKYELGMDKEDGDLPWGHAARTVQGA